MISIDSCGRRKRRYDCRYVRLSFGLRRNVVGDEADWTSSFRLLQSDGRAVEAESKAGKSRVFRFLKKP